MATATTPRHIAAQFKTETRIAALTEWREIVQRAADGDPVDIDLQEKIEKLARRIGFSPERFEIHVGVVQRHSKFSKQAREYQGKTPEQLHDALEAAAVQIRQQQDKLRELQRARFEIQEQLNVATQSEWEVRSAESSCPELYSNDLAAVIADWTLTDGDA